MVTLLTLAYFLPPPFSVAADGGKAVQSLVQQKGRGESETRVNTTPTRGGQGETGEGTSGGAGEGREEKGAGIQKVFRVQGSAYSAL